MNENRLEPRVVETNPVTVTVESAPDAPELENQAFQCSTYDLSVHGLRLALPSALPVGAKLRLEVALARPADRYRHLARVIWSHAAPDDIVLSHRAGLRISETLDRRALDWANAVETRLRGLAAATA
ncbi:MAG: PilZ domain-containing protein [Lentisphaerae bacterium]|nr:PilZ domain-containing protein [Lentisphaerota bacterium]